MRPPECETGSVGSVSIAGSNPAAGTDTHLPALLQPRPRHVVEVGALLSCVSTAAEFTAQVKIVLDALPAASYL